MSKGQTKAEIAAEKLKKERATQKPLQYSSASTTGLTTQGPKREYMSSNDSMMSTSKSNKPAMAKPSKPSRPTVKSVEVNKKPLAGVGSREISSPGPFRTDQQGNLNSMAGNFKNKSKANRIANRAAKTRGKGEAALESGNLAKAKRIRRKYDRQVNRLKKS